MLAFHTDADLPAAHIARDRDAIMRPRRVGQRQLAALLVRGRLRRPMPRAGFIAAHSAHLAPCRRPTAGSRPATPPSASTRCRRRGLFNALYTGLAAAEAADRHLSGAADALTDYGRAIADIWSAYRRDCA